MIAATCAWIQSSAGLRLDECCRLRVKDLDFERHPLTIRRGKRGKDRVTVLPATLRDPLRAHLAEMRAQHRRDLERGAGWVEFPERLEPEAQERRPRVPWPWVFPATRTYHPRDTGQRSLLQQSRFSE